MIVEIKHRSTGAVLYSCEVRDEIDSGLRVRHALEKATASGANLHEANLHGANLSGANLYGANLHGAKLHGANLHGANLYGANLSGANLSGANLYGAYLSGANLSWANLHEADLSGANLHGAKLHGANLSGANLYGANLHGAKLHGAYLHGADLYGANLHGANLHGAYLHGADLHGAKGADLAIARTRILPDGNIIGWKKAGSAIVKLSIPTEAKRSSAFGRKCRAEYADVIEIIGSATATTKGYGPEKSYIVGQRVFPDKWDDDWTKECSHGIHFYITRLEAENHS